MIYMACFLLDFGIISSVIKTNYIIATQLPVLLKHKLWNEQINTNSKQQMCFKRLKYYTCYLFLKFTKYTIIRSQ